MQDDQTPKRIFWWDNLSVDVTDPGERFVCLSNLPSSKKNEAWSSIKQDHPELAAILSSPELKQIAAEFQCTIYVDAKVLPELPGLPFLPKTRGF